MVILFNGYITDLDKLHLEFTNHINIGSYHFLETFLSYYKCKLLKEVGQSPREMAYIKNKLTAKQMMN